MQTINNSIEIKADKLKYLKNRRLDTKLNFTLGPFIYLFFALLITLRFQLNFNYSLFIFIILFFSLVIMIPYLGKRAWYKLNKLVVELTVQNDFIKLKTLKYESLIPKNEINFSRKILSVVGKDYNAICTIYNGKEYHIILDYFEEDINNILGQLNLID